MPGCKWSKEKWLCKLTEELGEVAECITKERSKADLGDELADVIHTAICNSIVNDIDIEEKLQDKFNRKSKQRNSKVFL